MKVIYYCYGSAHTSVLAAALHVGLLPLQKKADSETIKNLPYYDQVESDQIGSPILYGEDDLKNQVYILGLGGERKLMKQILYNYLELCGVNTNDIMLIGALTHANLWTKVGGFLSRRCGIITLGRPLTIYSLLKEYDCYVDLVLNVKQRLKQIAKAD
ncbi:DUF3189 family protein [Natroniella sulfidigena]|uniref:DUF3189 family protein n=1 Tax=Natroniella sulfidigena TaxID=723921 RepID=UPI00200A917B|nr:DUF3189 family protein [Natroniella sulfidigena]